MTLTRCPQQPIGPDVYYASECGRFVFRELYRQQGWGSLRCKLNGRHRVVRSLAAAEAECDRWAEELDQQGGT